MTQPLDVLKTRAMNAKPGEFKGALDLIRFTLKGGPMAFYKVGSHQILKLLELEMKTCFCCRAIFQLLSDWVLKLS